jgi:uncharacterized protein (DUF1684 family)
VSLTLLDWRRQVAGIYARVRAERDPEAAHRLWVEERQRLFREHPDSADREVSLRHAPYDAALRFVVDVDTDVAPQRLEIPTATDGVVPFERFGRVRLGELGALDVWWLASYGGGVWVPVRDANPETYGGGRYVLDTVKGADLGSDVDPSTGRGTLVVDLNFAYNPSCAYDERWACPLAPAGNVIAGSIDAGELVPAG